MLPEPSATLVVKGKEPELAGVPLSAPDPLSEIPPGRPPATSAQVRPPDPFAAASVWL